MAASNAVWGIDIGHCALKALRCKLSDDGKTLVAEAFDYIEYPKILTQPDAEPEQLVKEALQKFLDNNNVRDAKVGISVSGQSGLARFINLPPVDAKKIPDIVKFEAKQQIPFPLEDVIWDYQALGTPSPDDGIATDVEVGLFAMKRDQVFRALRPFRDAGIELDTVQLTPIAIYNAVTYGVIDGLSQADYDPDNPPDSIVVISMGTDTTDLVVTNGFKIWQRSIPIGGSHFTKQLMKEMKLTFAKAEHLKRHARDAEDPKAVFQAMRPVFNDMVQELQRSIGFFRSIDRSANITKGVILGNTVRLPGLQPYLEKNLEIPMKKIAEYQHLEGSSVVATPKYKDNVLSFAVSYGLCLQGLGKGRLSTNLIPRELITARIIRQKKPWAVAALALLMLGFAFNYITHWNRWRESSLTRFESEKVKLSSITNTSNTFKSNDDADKAKFDQLKDWGKAVVGGADSRFMVLELIKTINAGLPGQQGLDAGTVSELPYDKRPDLFITSVEMQYFTDVSDYANENVTGRYQQFREWLAANEKLTSAPATTTSDPATETDTAAEPDAETEADADAEPAAAEAGESSVEIPTVSGPGWVVQLKGFHCYDGGGINNRANYLINTVLKYLDSGEVTLPVAPGGALETFTTKEMGIVMPILANDGTDATVSVPDPDYVPDKNSDAAATTSAWGTGVSQVGFKQIPGYEFTIQFIWKENTVSDRLEKRNAAATDDSATAEDA
ncbi:MAG: type IV pilus assembly protein PilM [Planctomycetales bacterium]|nr:type IV pilus assembly protein PilM [Planctomycetales bacterium]